MSREFHFNASVRRFLFFGAVWFSLSAIAWPGHQEAAARPIDTVDADAQCGVESLYLAIVSVGDERPFEDIRQHCLPVPEQGYSVGELRDYSQSLGYETLVTQTNFDRLRARAAREKFGCVACLKEGHFVTIVDTTEEGYTIVNGTDLSVIDRRVFPLRWDGTVLLVAEQSLRDESAYEPWGSGVFYVIRIAAALSLVGLLFIRYQRKGS